MWRRRERYTGSPFLRNHQRQEVRAPFLSTIDVHACLGTCPRLSVELTETGVWHSAVRGFEKLNYDTFQIRIEARAPTCSDRNLGATRHRNSLAHMDKALRACVGGHILETAYVAIRHVDFQFREVLQL